MQYQKGFTLVELVIVIVILGLLAATALPRFINVTNEARLASMNGVAGGLRSAVALARAQYVVNGSNGATSVVMTGTTVATAAGTSNGGIPTNGPDGIGAAMPSPDGYTVVYGSDPVTYTPINGGSGTCQVRYDSTNGLVTVQSAGC